MNNEWSRLFPSWGPLSLRSVRMHLSPSPGGTKGTSGLCPECGEQGGKAGLAASAFPAKGPRRSRLQVERSLWNIILASYAFYTLSLFCEQIFFPKFGFEIPEWNRRGDSKLPRWFVPPTLFARPAPWEKVMHVHQLCTPSFSPELLSTESTRAPARKSQQTVVLSGWPACGSALARLGYHELLSGPPTQAGR